MATAQLHGERALFVLELMLDTGMGDAAELGGLIEEAKVILARLVARGEAEAHDAPAPDLAHPDGTG
jgi:hypothetical protein